MNFSDINYIIKLNHYTISIFNFKTKLDYLRIKIHYLVHQN